METQDIVMGVRISKRLHASIVAEQERISKLTGIKPKLHEVVRMILERGVKNGKHR
jgi:hypothetical protein